MERRGLNIYGSKLIKIPTPQYYVLYNGVEDAPSTMELKLSDAFVKESPKGKFERTATFVNLNKGKNDALLRRCRPLEEYMFLINRIRDNEAEGMRIEDAIDAEVQYCIAHNVLKEFLIAHRAEVLRVCLTEFNEEVFVNAIRAEGIEEGLARGHAKGHVEGLAEGHIAGERSMLVTLVREGRLSEVEAAEELGGSLEEFRKLLETERTIVASKETV